MCVCYYCGIDDDGEGDHEKNIVSKFLLASLSTVDTSKYVSNHVVIVIHLTAISSELLLCCC